MEWIVNSEEMKECDSNTIAHFGVPSLVLMERAALSVAAQIPEKALGAGRILLVCGNGNNGADGLAVARLLYQRGYKVDVAQMPDSGKRSPDNLVQRDILGRYGIEITDDIPKDRRYGCVIDALFGVGLSREPKGAYADWIYIMNQLDAYKVAVDMPSGVSSDDGKAYGPSFAADLTVTFAYRKAGQVLYPGCEKCGETVVADIGITDESWLARKPSCYALEPEDLKQLPQRPPRSNKGTYGHVLAVAGSANMAGAALFCAQAAYCAGCGLVKIYTPESNRTILQNALPEAILSVYDGNQRDLTLSAEKITLSEAILPVYDGNSQAVYQEGGQRGLPAWDGEWEGLPADGQASLLQELEWADVVILGPGIGKSEKAQSIVKEVLQAANVPVVLDADALNIVAGQLELLKDTPAKLIATPHLGEMARLCGKQVSKIQSAVRQTAEDFAKRYQLVCVLKDAVTVTAGPSGTCLNTSGCSAMAKGGSGDVLTGVIAALLAQGMEPEAAARMGVYVHGLAGEAAARKKGKYSVLARDIIDAIGLVMDGTGRKFREIPGKGGMETIGLVMDGTGRKAREIPGTDGMETIGLVMDGTGRDSRRTGP